MVGKLLVPMIISMCGCSFDKVMNYPQEWPRAETAVGGQCPDISGAYSIVSELRPDEDTFRASYPYGFSKISLYGILINHYETEYPYSGIVDVNQGDGVLSFSFHYGEINDRGELKHQEKKLKSGIDYSCNSDGVHIVPQEKTSSGGMMPAVGGVVSEKIKITFVKSVDGSLLANIKKTASVAALIFVLPYFGSESHNVWWRWKKAEGK